MRRAALLLAMCLLAGAARADNNDADDRLGGCCFARTQHTRIPMPRSMRYPPFLHAHPRIPPPRAGAGWAVACGTSGAPGSWQPLANASAISGAHAALYVPHCAVHLLTRKCPNSLSIVAPPVQPPPAGQCTKVACELCPHTPTPQPTRPRTYRLQATSWRRH